MTRKNQVSTCYTTTRKRDTFFDSCNTFPPAGTCHKSSTPLMET